jgi:hypothetical protein
VRPGLEISWKSASGECGVRITGGRSAHGLGVRQHGHAHAALSARQPRPYACGRVPPRAPPTSGSHAPTVVSAAVDLRSHTSSHSQRAPPGPAPSWVVWLQQFGRHREKPTCSNRQPLSNRQPPSWATQRFGPREAPSAREGLVHYNRALRNTCRAKPRFGACVATEGGCLRRSKHRIAERVAMGAR